MVSDLLTLRSCRLFVVEILIDMNVCHCRYTNTTDNDLSYWGLDYPPLSAYQVGPLIIRAVNS